MPRSGAKIGRGPAFQAVHRHHVIAGQRTEALVAGLYVGFGYRLAILLHAAKTPLGLAAKEMNEVHHVAAEHPQVLAAATLIFLAAAAELEAACLACPSR